MSTSTTPTIREQIKTKVSNIKMPEMIDMPDGKWIREPDGQYYFVPSEKQKLINTRNELLIARGTLTAFKINTSEIDEAIDIVSQQIAEMELQQN
jgi:hypothetical protein